MSTPSTSILVGALGLGVFQVVGLYDGMAPSMADLREANSRTDIKEVEALMDADIVVGSIVILVSLLSMWATDSAWPIVLLGGGFVLVAAWHHLVLVTTSTKER